LLLEKWADLTALGNMQRTRLDVAAKLGSSGDEGTATVTLANKSNRIAFFVRLELTKGIDGDEVLPSTYEDNYITLFPRESRTIRVHFHESQLAGSSPSVRLEDYNVPKVTATFR